MRRTTTALGTLAAATMIALAVPGSAYAAQGTLTINGLAYQNPSGCVNVEGSPPPVPVQVTNATNEYAFIFSHPDCEGPLAAPPVPPGNEVQVQRASSIRIY